jgi:isoamylase
LARSSSNDRRIRAPRDSAAGLVALRKGHPVFRRRRFLAGAQASELQWFTPGGTAMTAAQWSDRSALAIALYLDGCDDPDRAADGTPLVDDDFLVLVNAWWEPLDFVLPVTRDQAGWRLELDTYALAPAARAGAGPRTAGQHVTVSPRSLVVLSDPRRAD